MYFVLIPWAKWFNLRHAKGPVLKFIQEAWDSYIQNGNPLDPSLQLYPAAGFDPLQPNVGDMQTDPNSYGSSVFMGANTPGKN
jgi:hypothetical protein